MPRPGLTGVEIGVGQRLADGERDRFAGEPCRDTCIVGIAVVRAYATAALRFVPRW
jgi:hypothetical protein